MYKGIKSERVVKPETIDARHAAAQAAIPAARPIAPVQPPMKASAVRPPAVAGAGKSLYHGTAAEKQQAQTAVRAAVSRPGTVKNLASADVGIDKGKKPK